MFAVIAKPAEPQDDWPIGVAIPIKVTAGKARIVVPSRSSSDRVLVIVSSLSRTPGEYPVQISSRSASRPQPAHRHVDPPARSPRFPPHQALKPPPPPAKPSPAERTFWLPVRDGDLASAKNHVALRASLRAQGERVAIYVDPEDCSRVEASTLDDLVSTFDNSIYPRALSEIGTAADIDGDGRIAILLSGWLGHLADGRLAVDGFVRGADFEKNQRLPFGNASDLIYLNAAMESGPHLRTVLAHEYTHAVTYCSKALGAAGQDEEAWLDEALAHLAEDLHGFSRSNLDYRVDAFLASPERYRLLVKDYGTPSLIRSHGHRGSAYRFLRWCADRYGPRLLGTLVRSELRGVASLESATGCPFATLYREWASSFVLDALKTGNSESIDAPRSSYIALGDEDRFVLDGTTSHYAIVDGSQDGAVDLTVEGLPNAELQVTAIRLPLDLPRVDLAVSLEKTPEGANAIRARIRGRDAQIVTLDSLRWFPANPSSNASERAIRSGNIENIALVKVLRTTEIAGRGFIVSQPIAISPSALDQPLIVVLSGRDARGRRVCSWAELSPSHTAAD